MPPCWRNGKCILIGDGAEACKDGRKIPGVAWMRQESGDLPKKEHAKGHMSGCISIFLRKTAKQAKTSKHS
ncbi:MAG: hypothetical protein LBU32_16595 [Clostridiales bacterium]|nr:hypothetical protein [Clostridiales bacterium]